MGWVIASPAILGLGWVLEVNTIPDLGLRRVFNGISRRTGYSWDYFIE